MNFLRKAGQSVVSISCSKSCGTHAQLTGGQALFCVKSAVKVNPNQPTNQQAVRQQQTAQCPH